MGGSQQLRAGRYTLRGVLGEGAQGKTFEAIDAQTGRTVAIKRYDVRGAKSWKEVELAEREARVLATIDHPLVPRYVEHFEEDGALFLVMEKVDGETLEAIVARDGALPEPEVRRFLACADRAFSYLHGRAAPVVHRDVKPRNVIRRRDGSYVFVDFGAVSELFMRRTGSTVAGTLGYMAPEQLHGRALPATDVYAVGATALAALTGLDPDRLPRRGLHVDVRAALGGRASESLVLALERMLEPDPDRRAATLGDALDAAASVPPPPMPVAQPDLARENAAVKSLRALLWMLWGLCWIIVPVAHKAFAPAHTKEMIPLIMFGSLGAILVVNWHKGALLRLAYRAMTGALQGQSVVASTPLRARVGEPRARVADEARIRVRGTSLPAIEAYRDTEVATPQRAARTMLSPRS
jgi:tRNA A-37 threonylcarbamoyl transferase component Bud32